MEFELNIIRAIQSIANPFLDGLFQFITMFGEEAILIPLIAVIYWSFNKKMGEYIAYASLTSVLVNGAIKDIFKAKRPIGEPGIRSLRVETATGYSFPSGHTQGTASFWSAIAIYLKKSYMYGISGLIIVLVAISRLYLGVHYPKDVLFGAIFGILTSFITYKLFNKVNNKIALYFITFIIFIPALLYAHSADFIKGMGTFLGFALGIYVEKKYVNFSVEGKSINKILRVVIGLAILILLKVGLKAVFPNKLVFHFLRYFIIVFFGIGLYPAIFKKLKL